MKHFYFLFIALLNFQPGESQHRAPAYFHHPPKEYSFFASYLQPTGDFSQNYSQGTYPVFKEALTESLQGNMGAKGGFGMDVSGYYYFNREPVGTIGGVKITFLSLSSIPFKWETAGDHIYNNAHYSPIWFYSFNIGPVLRIAITDRSAIRIYDQLCGVIGWNGGWSNTADYTSFSSDKTKMYVSHAQGSLKLNSGSGFKNEAGISINIGSAIAAFGYSLGPIEFDHVNYNSTTNTDVYVFQSENGYQYQSTTHDGQSAQISASIPTNYFFFSLGYLLEK